MSKESTDSFTSLFLSIALSWDFLNRWLFTSSHSLTKENNCCIHTCPKDCEERGASLFPHSLFCKGRKNEHLSLSSERISYRINHFPVLYHFIKEEI